MKMMMEVMGIMIMTMKLMLILSCYPKPKQVARMALMVALVTV